MSVTENLITIGFNKNGEADFGIRSDIMDLSLERMNQLRQMIPVAIGVAEQMFRDARDKEFQAQTCLVETTTERKE